MTAACKVTLNMPTGNELTVAHQFKIPLKGGKQLSFSANRNVSSSPHSLSKVMATGCDDTPVPQFHPSGHHAHLTTVPPILLESEVCTPTVGPSNLSVKEVCLFASDVFYEDEKEDTKFLVCCKPPLLTIPCFLLPVGILEGFASNVKLDVGRQHLRVLPVLIPSF